jgi:DnaK suppressor protein
VIRIELEAETISALKEMLVDMLAIANDLAAPAAAPAPAAKKAPAKKKAVKKAAAKKEEPKKEEPKKEEPAAEPAPVELTLDKVKKIAEDYMKRTNVLDLQRLLAKHKAKSVSDMDPKAWSAFVAEAQA